jgi:hypothetical protein
MTFMLQSATDNQVKTLSARNADREGHCADAIADALFRITFCCDIQKERAHTDLKCEPTAQLYTGKPLRAEF